MDNHAVSIDMEPPSEPSSEPRLPSTPHYPRVLEVSTSSKPSVDTPYPINPRDLDNSTPSKPFIIYRREVDTSSTVKPAVPYPPYRRSPISRQHSEEQFQMRLHNESMTSRPTSYQDFVTMRYNERNEPNYPTRPVFSVDPLNRAPSGEHVGLAYRSTSSNLPGYYPKPPPARSTSSRGCNCQCHCNDSPRRMSQDSTPVMEEDPTSEDLSWRRLHMSRAKLKATATTSELLSGFAMVAMVELQINSPTNVPEWLFVMFSVCTTVLVAVHIFALMISTYLLPNIDAVSKLHVRGLVAESPHERMRGFIELAWAFSTVLGLFLFLVEVAILCWVKFWDYSFTAAWAATVIVIPVLIVFVAFAVHFYHNLVVYKVKSSVSDLERLEQLKLKLDSVTILNSSPA